MELDELLRTPGAELAHGTFNDAVVVPGKWVARFPRADVADAARRARALRLIGRLGLPFAVPDVIEDRLDLPPGRAHVIVSYLPGEPSEIASDEAVLCADDPALDAAAFASYGWPLVRRVRPEFYERARTHAAMFPLTGAVSTLRQGDDPAKFLAWFRRRCAVREHPPAGWGAHSQRQPERPIDQR